MRSQTQACVEDGYEVGSGVFTAVSPDVITVLDEYGRYVSEVGGDGPTAGWEALDAVNAMSTTHPDLRQLSTELFAEQGVSFDPLLGYHRALYAGHVKQGEFRRRGSSGGIATWLLEELLAAGLADAVIHVKPNPGGDPLFTYQISRTVEELRAGAGSKYYPVELSRVLNEVRTTPGRYALVGIPSVITEARLLARTQPVFAERLAWMIGLVCGHQKTTKWVEALAWESGITPGDLTGVVFRKKADQGLAYDYQMEFTGRIDGRLTTIQVDPTTLFAADWGHGFFKARFSDYTDDAFNQLADMTLGDAWVPPYTRDPQGANVVIVRDPTLARIVAEGARRGVLHLNQVASQVVTGSQAGLVRHTSELGWRLAHQDRRGAWRPEGVPGTASLAIVRRLIQRNKLRIAETSHIRYREAVSRGSWAHFRRTMRLVVSYQRALHAIDSWITLAERVIHELRTGGIAHVVRLVHQRRGR